MKKAALAGILMLTLTACGTTTLADLSGTREQSIQAQGKNPYNCRFQYEQAMRLFAQTDRNKDRKVSPTEARTTSFANFSFVRLDEDKDGYVSEGEFSTDRQAALCGDPY